MVIEEKPIVGSQSQCSENRCLLNNLGAYLIQEEIRRTGRRVTIKAFTSIADEITKGWEEENSERETLFMPLHQQTSETNQSLPLLYISGTAVDSAYEKPPNLPFPEPFVVSNEDRNVTPQKRWELFTYNLGITYFQIGNVHSALTCFALAMSTTSDFTIKTACFNNIAFISCYAKHQIDETRMKAARDYLRRKFGRQTHRQSILLARTLLTDGYIQYNQCNYQGALRYCLLAQKLPDLSDDDHLCLLYNIGLLRYHLEDWASSLEHFEKFIRSCQLTGNSTATALYFLGMIHQDHGDLRCSLGYLVQSLKLDPNSSATWHAIANVLHDSDDLENALKAYCEALKFSPDNSLSAAKILVDTGRLHHLLFSIDESVSAYRKALSIIQTIFGEISVFAASLLVIIGNLCVEQGRINDAMVAFINAQRIVPHQLIARYRFQCPRNPHAACA